MMTTMKHVKWSDRLGLWVARVTVKASSMQERCIYSYDKTEAKARAWADMQLLAVKQNPNAAVICLINH